MSSCRSWFAIAEPPSATSTPCSFGSAGPISATIVAVIPQSSYAEFTRGLAQIGSWNLEASRSTLPDPVHVAVRLAK
jgi:hypothetical protein